VNDVPIFVTTAASLREERPMQLVDCPICDTPAPFDPNDDALFCPHCAVRLEVAPDEGRALAEAA